MNLLLSPVPLFNRDMVVEAYFFHYQKGNVITLEGQVAARMDSVIASPLLELLRDIGIEAFAMEKQIFVPISSYMLLGNLKFRHPGPYDKIIFLLGDDAMPTDEMLASISDLQRSGFRFAAAYQEGKPLAYEPILQFCEYLFLNQKTNQARFTVSNLPQSLRHLNLVATNIDWPEDFKKIKKGKIELFEGQFYRLPVTKGNTTVSPLKANLIRLLNTVNDSSFEFGEVAAIIERDPALSFSLMRLINSPFIGLPQKVRTIGHAVTLLGQDEIRKWAVAAVSREIGSDKPDEITRLSLIRAKFADNLAPLFDMNFYKKSLFLMGLFSVLDIVLDVPMEEVMRLVHVDDRIRDALVDYKGIFAPVMQLIHSYEMADWKDISRRLILNDIQVEDLCDAYTKTILWYATLIFRDAEMEKTADQK